METQKVKIEFNGNKVFFFDHSFKSALYHAEKFIDRNLGKHEMELFILNKNNFGEKWIKQN